MNGNEGSGLTEPLTRDRRLTILGVGREAALDGFRADVQEGLLATRKRLSCEFLYDHQGSLLFEEICRLPEYYLTRCEEALLREHVAAIVDELPAGVTLVELGSGSSTKTRILIDELLGDRRPPGHAHEPRSHFAVAAAVAQGRADWGVTIEICGPCRRGYATALSRSGAQIC
jgi:hypothetical protein